MAYLFIFLIASFKKKVTLKNSVIQILMKSNLSVFSFIDHVFGVTAKKYLPNQGHKDFRSFNTVC